MIKTASKKMIPLALLILAMSATSLLPGKSASKIMVFNDFLTCFSAGVARADAAPAAAPVFFPVASSPDGALTAERSYGQRFRVRAEEQVLWQRDDLKISDHQTALFSPDGRLVVTLGWQTQLWEARTGVLRATLHESDFPTISGAIAPDGKTLAAGSWDAIVRFWDINTGQALGEWKNAGGVVEQLLWLDDGKSLLVNLYHNEPDALRSKASPNSLLESGGLTRRSYPGGEQLWNAMPHEGEINRVVLAPGGDKILTGGRDGQVFLWDLAGGENHALHITVPRPQAPHLEFSRDGQLALIAWGRDAWLYRLPAGELAATLDLPGWKQVRLSDDARSIFDPQTQQSVPIARALALGGEPLLIPGIAPPRPVDEMAGEEPAILETTNGGEMAPTRRLAGWRAIAFAPNRQFVVALPRNPQDIYVYLWNEKLTRIMRRFRHPLNSVEAIEIAPDNQTLWLTGTLDYDSSRQLKGKIVRLDLQSGQSQLLASFPAAPGYASLPAAAISPDYAGVAYLTRELKPEAKEKMKELIRPVAQDYFYTLHVVDVATGQLLWQRTDASLENVISLSLAPRREGSQALALLSRKRIAPTPPATPQAGEDEMRMGGGETDESEVEVVEMQAYNIKLAAPVEVAQPAADGKKVDKVAALPVDTTRQDAWTRMWQASDADLQTAALKSRAMRYAPPFSALTFSPDGRWLATPGGLWDANNGRLRNSWPQAQRVLWSQNSRWLWLGGGEGISRLQVDAMKPPLAIPAAGSLIGVAPQGERVATDEDTTLLIWDQAPTPQ